MTEYAEPSGGIARGYHRAASRVNRGRQDLTMAWIAGLHRRMRLTAAGRGAGQLPGGGRSDPGGRAEPASSYRL